MKAVRHTKEPSLNQMAIMVANLKEKLSRDCSIKIEKPSWQPLFYTLYLSAKRDTQIEAEIINALSWEDLQQVYFNKIEVANV